MFDYFITTLPHFLAYFAASAALAVAFLYAYTLITPQDEFALIREGKSAPAISISGALIGFAIPLSTVIQHSESIPDLVLWGVVVLGVQVAVFFGARVVVPNLCVRIEKDEMSAGIYAAGMAIGFGILNAGCMTP